MPTIKSWLDNSAKQLSDIGIASARLDVELILAHTVRKSRTYLHAHENDSLSSREYEVANARLELRLDRVPIAYIIGHKEFYGRRFKVSTATLIPRPESENMIELLKDTLYKLNNKKYKTLVDIGTGSGCIGITAKLEIPELSVTLSDIDNGALYVANYNADKYQVDIDIIKSDLLQRYPINPDIILANLPYVDRSWDLSPETRHEPKIALFANNNGRDLIEKLIYQSTVRQLNDSLLFLEADPWQHTSIINFAHKHGYAHLETRDYIIAFSKLSVGG